MCSRISPCSVASRSRIPGYSFHSASRASARVIEDCSMTIWLFPAAKERKRPGRTKVTGILPFPPDSALFTRRPPLAGDGLLSVPRRATDPVSPNNGALHANHGRQAIQNLLPGLSFVGRTVQLSAARAEVDASRVERVGRHGIAQDGFKSSFLRQAARQRFPGFACVARAIDAQAAFGSAAELVGLYRHDVDAVGIARVSDHRKTKVRRHIIRNILPGIAVVVGAVQAPVVLQEESFRARGVHSDLMHALAELRIFLRKVYNANTPIACLPFTPPVFGGVDATSRNRRIHPLRILGVKQDGVQGQAAKSWHPAGAVRMVEQSAH